MKWTKTYSKLMIGTEIAFNSLVSRNGNSPFNGFKKNNVWKTFSIYFVPLIMHSFQLILK